MGCRVRQLDAVNSFQSVRFSQQQPQRSSVSVITSTGSRSSFSSLLSQLLHQQRHHHHLRYQRFRTKHEPSFAAVVILLALSFNLLSTSTAASVHGQPSYRQYIERQRATSGSGSGAQTTNNNNRPNVVRYYKLHNRCSGQHLSIYGRHVDALAPFTSQNARLRIDSVWFGSRVRIQSDVSRNFMCFNKRGQLIVRRAAATDYCEFREVHAANGFTEFRSVANESWSVGFGRNGRRLPGAYVDVDVPAHGGKSLQSSPLPPSQTSTPSSLINSPHRHQNHHHQHHRLQRSTTPQRQLHAGDDVRLTSDALAPDSAFSSGGTGSTSAAVSGVGLSAAKAAARRRCYQFTKTDFPYIDDQQPQHRHSPTSRTAVNVAAAADAEDATFLVVQTESRGGVGRRDSARASTGHRHRQSHGLPVEVGSSVRRQPPPSDLVASETDGEPSAPPRIDYGEWFVRQVLNRKRKIDDDKDDDVSATGCATGSDASDCTAGNGDVRHGSSQRRKHQRTAATKTTTTTTTTSPVRRRARTTTLSARRDENEPR